MSSSFKRGGVDYTTLACGLADVVNPPFQFNSLDDVRSDLSFPHYGRMYKNRIKDNLPIVFIEVGHLRISENPLALWAIMGGSRGDRATGDFIRKGMDARDFLGDVAHYTKAILTKPLGFLVNVFSRGKLFSFETAANLYSKYVSDMMFDLVWWLNLYNPYEGMKTAFIKSVDDVKDYIAKAGDAIDAAMYDVFGVVRSPTQQKEINELLNLQTVPGGSTDLTYEQFIYGANDEEVKTLKEQIASPTDSYVSTISSDKPRTAADARARYVPGASASAYGVASVGRAGAIAQAAAMKDAIATGRTSEASATCLTEECPDSSVPGIDTAGTIDSASGSGSSGEEKELRELGDASPYVNDILSPETNFTPKVGYSGAYTKMHIFYFLPDYGADYKTARQIILPYMLQRGISVSESFSNSFTDHPIAGQLNEMSQSSQAQKNALLGLAGGTVGDAQVKFTDWLKSTMKSASLRAVAPGREMSYIATGDARLAFPQIWENSSFSRTITLNFKLFSPYGHPLSIFENIFVPFLMLLTIASPRQIGANSYAAPFAIKAYARSLFSCDLGFIESLTIERGSDKNELTVAGLPRVANVSVSIKDVLPNMMLSMNARNREALTAKNASMMGYLRTIAGLGPLDEMTNIERAAWWNTKDAQSISTLMGGKTLQGFWAERTPEGIHKLIQNIAGVRRRTSYAE